MSHTIYGWYASPKEVRDERTEDEADALSVSADLEWWSWFDEIMDNIIERIHDKRLLANWGLDAQGIGCEQLDRKGAVRLRG